MDKLKSDNFDEDDSLSPEDWDGLIELLNNPATANHSARKLMRFVVRQVLANDGAGKLRSLGRRLSLDDLAQSAMGSILRVADNYKDKRGDELRAIFRTIIDHKKADKHRYHRQARRDIRKEESSDDGDNEKGQRPQANDDPQRFRPGNSNPNYEKTIVNESEQTSGDRTPNPLLENSQFTIAELISIVVQGASPEESLLFRETVEQIPAQLREVCAFTLVGFSGDEIAKELGCSRRTVVRRQKLVRIELGQILGTVTLQSDHWIPLNP